MLGGFGGATKDKNINGRLTSLCLIGGVDCKPGYTPDLKVQGGARIKKTLCVLGSAYFTDLDVSGNIHTHKDLTVDGNVNLNNINVDAVNANIISANSAVISDNLLVCGNTYLKGDLTVLGNIDFDCGVLDNVNEIIVNTIIAGCGTDTINMGSDVDVFGNVSVSDNMVVCGDERIKGNLIVEGDLIIANLMYETIVANALYSNITITNNLITENIDLQCGILDNVQVLNVNTIAADCGSTQINIMSNVDMKCQVISNVMALHVGNLYGKSPIQVHDNFNIKKDVVGKGKITWDSGIEIGSDLTIADNNNSIAIGKGSVSHQYNAISIGTQANSTQYSIAIGSQSLAIETINNNLYYYNNNSGPEGTCVSIGPGSLSHYKGVSIGNGSKGGSLSITIGNSSRSFDTQCITIGNETFNDGSRGISIGAQSFCVGNDGVSLGFKAISQINSVAIGSYSTTQNGNSVALGYRSFCTTDLGIAIGRSSLNRSTNSVVIGSHSRSDILATGATIVGDHAYTRGNNGVSVGDRSYCYSSNSVSMGSNARVYTFSNNSVAIGYNSFLNNSSNSIAIGANSSITYRLGAIAIGSKSQGLANYSVSIGYNTAASTVGSVEIQKSNYATPTSTAKVWGQTFQNRTWNDSANAIAFINGTGDIVKGGSTLNTAASNYVFAYDTTQQTVGTIGTFQNVVFSTMSLDSWTFSPPNTFVCAVNGTYKLSVTCEVDGGGGQHQVVICFAVNGSEVPGTIQATHLESGAGSFGSLSTEGIVNLISGDSLTVQFTGDSTSVHIGPHALYGLIIPGIKLTIIRLL